MPPPETQEKDYQNWQKMAGIIEDEPEENQKDPSKSRMSRISRITHKTLRTNQTWSSFQNQQQRKRYFQNFNSGKNQRHWFSKTNDNLNKVDGVFVGSKSARQKDREREEMVTWE